MISNIFNVSDSGGDALQLFGLVCLFVFNFLSALLAFYFYFYFEGP